LPAKWRRPRDDRRTSALARQWRYKDHETGPEWILAVKQAAEELGDTSPSRTKAAAHVMRNRAKYGLPETPTHSWCGLAGKPEWWAK
jgi:hypothetical protein